MNKSELKEVIKLARTFWDIGLPTDDKAVMDVWFRLLKPYNKYIIFGAIRALSVVEDSCSIMNIVDKCRIIKKLEENKIEESYLFDIKY